MTDIPGAIGRTTRVPRGLGHSAEQRESVTYCRVVNPVRVDVARHCRAHQTPRLAVLWTEVPTLEGLYRLGMKGRAIAEYFALAAVSRLVGRERYARWYRRLGDPPTLTL